MLKTMTALAFILASVPAALAQNAEPAKPSVASQCGEQWKAFKKENGKPAKGEGRDLWQAFYKACREKLGTTNATASDRAKLTAAIEAYAKQ